MRNRKKNDWRSKTKRRKKIVNECKNEEQNMEI